MGQARHLLNIRALTIFFPFATIPAALHYFSIHFDYFLHNMVCYLFHFFHCTLLTPSHVAPSPLTTLLSPLLAIHPRKLAQKIGISLVAASQHDTCDQNGKPSTTFHLTPAAPPSPQQG